MTAFGHVNEVIGAVNDGLRDWATALMTEGGVGCGVTGHIPSKGKPTLALLPYQMVLESQHTVPTLQLMPQPTSGATRETIPAAWRTIGQSMTGVLLESFPERAKGRPGVGPIDPMPPLASLPPPIAAWYKAHKKDWVLNTKEPRARLPSISWRQPFGYTVRYAAIVVDPSGQSTEIDSVRLRALGVFAAGVRLQRFFTVTMPPLPTTKPLEELIAAFGKVKGEAAEPIAEALKSALSNKTLAVGVTPHNELSDADLALVCMALKQPMQPAMVFSVRLSLGSGPELGAGAMPHLESVEKGEEPS